MISSNDIYQQIGSFPEGVSMFFTEPTFMPNKIRNIGSTKYFLLDPDYCFVY
jgi:hypothetical protein